jgi:hypothetical protein
MLLRMAAESVSAGTHPILLLPVFLIKEDPLPPPYRSWVLAA